MSDQASVKYELPKIEANIDIVGMIECCIMVYRSFQSASENPRPLRPDEMDGIHALAQALGRITKHAYRQCWDGKAWCRYRESACVFNAKQLTEDPSQIIECKWRGKEI